MTAARRGLAGARASGGRLSTAPALALAVAIVLVAAGCDDGATVFPDDGGGFDPGCGGTFGGGGGAGGADAAISGGGFTIIALPDTQYYSSTYPGIFAAQMTWILDQRVSRRIPFVVHEGDVVDSDVAAQWEVASQNLHRLDGIVPYVLAQGNHDYFYASNGLLDRATLVNQYFQVATFAMHPGFLGSFEEDRVENTAHLLTMGGTPWLVISLEFGPRSAVLTWADGILKAHADTPALVVTHAYLYWDGSRYDHIAHPVDQDFSPYHYFTSPPPGAVNDGEEMWTKLIEPNENVQFVVSGHVFNYATRDAAARLTSTHPSGRKVHQIVANYQESALGGGGYLRLMEFCPGAGEVRVSTYSPYLDSWKRDPANQFTLPLP